MNIKDNDIAKILGIIKMKNESATTDFINMVLHNKLTKEDKIKLHILSGEMSAYTDLIIILEKMLEGEQ